MADINDAKRDGNYVTSMLFKGSDGLTYPVKGDEITGRLLVDNAGGGTGTVTSVSVVTANGFAGTVATATTTPAITLSTTITGLLKGNGTAISAAVANTDYQSPITLTTTGSSGPATFNGTTLNIPQYTAGGGGTVVSVVGTSNRISVDSTDPANPIVNIAATYVGQSSITTLGTVGTGVWQGTVVAGQYGGTGVANTGKTITLGGNFTTSGAFTTTLTVGANTNVTLPSTGTLATLAGSEALTNKSVNGVTLVSGGTASLYLSQDGTYTTPAGGGGLTVGTTTITSGTTTKVLFDNAGILGEYTISGTGNVAMTNSPVFTTPILGAATYTTLSGGNITDSGLTAGRVTFAGTAGLLSDADYLTVSASGANADLLIGQPTGTFNVGRIQLSYSGSVNDARVILVPANGTSGNRTITIPNTTDTLVGKATTDTLTNKTATGATNTLTASLLKSATTEVSVSAATAPSSGQVLTATSSTAATWQTPTIAFSPTITYSTFFEGAGRFATVNSGGTGSFGVTGINISTSATGNRYAGYGSGNGSIAGPKNPYDGTPTMNSSFQISTIGTAGFFMVSVGTPISGGGVDANHAHFGFKVEFTAGPTATLYGSQANGTTESKTSALTTLTNTDVVEVCARKNSTTSIDYYWQKNGGGWSSASNVTTNLPSGSDTEWFSGHVNNASTATTNTVQVFAFTYQR